MKTKCDCHKWNSTYDEDVAEGKRVTIMNMADLLEHGWPNPPPKIFGNLMFDIPNTMNEALEELEKVGVEYAFVAVPTNYRIKEK